MLHTTMNDTNSSQDLFYQIIPKGDYHTMGMWILQSVAKTSFGGDAINFVREGTYDECEQTKQSLENHAKSCLKW